MRTLGILCSAIVFLLEATKSVSSSEYEEYSQNITHLSEKLLMPAVNGNSSLVIFMNGDFS